MPMPHRDTAQSGRAPGLIESLHREWPEWCQTPGVREAFAKWRSDHEVLAGFESLGDLTGATASMDAPTIDAVFGTLLSYATDLEDPSAPVAARVLLQLMLPKVAQLAMSLGHVREIADREAYAVTGMYEAIRTYPLKRWPRMTPLCLARWGRWMIHRSAIHQRHQRINEFPVDLETETWLTERPEPSPSPELVRLLVWAVRKRVITRLEARRLFEGVRYGSAIDTAERQGVEINSVHRSRFRAIRKLRKKIGEYDPDLPF